MARKNTKNTNVAPNTLKNNESFSTRLHTLKRIGFKRTDEFVWDMLVSLLKLVPDLTQRDAVRAYRASGNAAAGWRIRSIHAQLTA